MPQHRRLPDEYQDIRWIGSGQHGDVYKCIHLPTGMLYARKYILMHTSDAASQLVRELSVLSRGALRHQVPQLLRLKAVWADEVTQQVSLITEYCSDGSLKDWIERKGTLSEDQLALVAKSVLLALVHMKRQFGIHHRDIKPANILIDGTGRVKIADFGEAGNQGHLLFGTLGYKSPECLDAGNKIDFNDNRAEDLEKADVWSLGLALIEGATGKFPYESLSIIELWEAVKYDPSPGLPTGNYSPAARHFVDECLRKDPEKRASIDYLLQHPFLKRATKDTMPS